MNSLRLLMFWRKYSMAQTMVVNANLHLWNHITTSASFKERGTLMPWDREAIDILAAAAQQCGNTLIRREVA